MADKNHLVIEGTPRQRAAIRAIVADVCTGTYGASLASGEASWSGGDLMGRARHWSARYWHRREEIMCSLARRGVVVDRRGATLHLSAATHRVTVAEGAMAGLAAYAIAVGPDFRLATGGVSLITKEVGLWRLDGRTMLVERAPLPR